MSIVFGTGGFRAIIGEGFTKENVQKIGSAIAEIIFAEKLKNTVIIGYDRRFLSKEAAQWLSECFASKFIQVQFVDKASPTPLIMFALQQSGLDFGFMITASHNPATYNGIKVFTHGGKDADVSMTSKIEMYANAVEQVLMDDTTFEEYIGEGRICYLNPMNAYLDSILRIIDTEAIKNKHLKVALDPMYGVGQTSLQTILLTTRCEVSVIHERHDTLFGGKLPAPTVTTIVPLQNYVLEKGCDIGIATDGDADRIGIIDDKGRFLSPNDILVILYYYLKAYKHYSGPVVRNVSTTHRLDRVAEYFNEACYEVPVGFKNITQAMVEYDALVGGESSGGLAVRGHIHGKDGIYAGALLVELIACVGMPLSQFSKMIDAKFGVMSSLELEYKLSHNKRKEVERAMECVEVLDFGSTFETVSKRDGLKLNFEDGWVLMRFSGTEPLLRLVGEANSEAILSAKFQTVVNYFKL